MLRVTAVVRRAVRNVQHIADAVAVDLVHSASGSFAFRSQPQNLWKPAHARGVFGGQVLAQSLSSAGRTVRDDMSLHSVHSYFLLGADPQAPIEFDVQRLRDGGRYASRATRAQQGGKTIFMAMSSYHSGELDQPSFQLDLFAPWAGPACSHSTMSNASWAKAHGLAPFLPSPDSAIPPAYSTDVAQYTSSLLPPEQSRPTEARFCRLLTAGSDAFQGMDDPAVPASREAIEAYLADRRYSPFEIRDADPNMWDENGRPLPGTRQAFWLRARETVLGDKPSSVPDLNKVSLAYASDFNFLPTITKALALHKASMIVTLDHSMHFYRADFDAHDWMLYVMQAQAANNGRGVVLGRIYRRDGALIAVAVCTSSIRRHTTDPTCHRLKKVSSVMVRARTNRRLP